MPKFLKKQFPKGYFPNQISDGVYIDRFIQNNLDEAIDRVENRNFDFVIALDGMERWGKTTLGLQFAFYLDPTFCLDRVVFDPETFLKVIKKAKKGQCIVYDESTGISSRSSLSTWNKRIVNIISQIGSKNLYIIFILPSIFELDKYLSLHRCSMLVHIDHRSGERGNYWVYDRARLKFLYLYGKKFYTYSKPKCNFAGRFTKPFLLDEKKYEKKKQAAIIMVGEKPVTRRQQIWMSQRNNAIKIVLDRKLMTRVELSKQLKGINSSQVGDIYRNMTENTDKNDSERR